MLCHRLFQLIESYKPLTCDIATGDVKDIQVAIYQTAHLRHGFRLCVLQQLEEMI